jgi:L-2-hydroxyglutarate oxidase LhgO
VERFDCAVVGAGAVGLALARQLAQAGRSVLAVERHDRHGLETSSRNSEVVHSGLYYPKGSLKARLCLEGNRELYRYCRERGVFVRNTGKLIVACEESEVGKLSELRARGEANGVEGLELLDPAELARRAPGVRAVAALWVPSTGIVDSEGLMAAYLREAEDAGAVFLWSAGLSRVERETDGYVLTLASGESAHARRVFNSAGLHADAVARLAGIDAYRLHWFKGEYFQLRRPQGVDTLVYPVPAKHGLGIHLTLDARGGQRLGPNAFAVQNLDYGIDNSHAETFWAAARRYLPDLKREDLMPGTTGIRPKLSADGTFADFVVAEESARGFPGWVNLVGIESPGLTCSLALARLAAGLVG